MVEGMCGCFWERLLELENGTSGSLGERRQDAGCQEVGGVPEAENRRLTSEANPDGDLPKGLP